MEEWRAIPIFVFTDNYPLDKGKIHIARVEFGCLSLSPVPEVVSGVKSEVVVNGLDFYPTILGWTGTPNSAKQILDGSDLGALLGTTQPMPPRLWMAELISQESRCSGIFPMDTASNPPILKMDTN